MATKKPAAKPVAKKPIKAVKPAVKKPVPVKKAPKPASKKSTPVKNSSKPALKPVHKAAKPVSKKPMPKTVTKPVAKSKPKPASKPVAKPAAKHVAHKAAPVPVAKHTVHKSATVPAAKQVAHKTAPVPAAKPIVKSKSVVVKVIPTKPSVEIKAKDIKVPPPKPVVLPKITTKTSRKYEPGFTKSVLDRAPIDQGAPLIRYSDVELSEFRELIQRKMEAAKKELNYLQGLITRKDEMGGDETDNRYMTMEDGSLSMEREQLSQMASRQITFVDHLEKALMRIENQTYGICRITGKLIDKARLRAVPHATLSIEAKMGIAK